MRRLLKLALLAGAILALTAAIALGAGASIMAGTVPGSAGNMFAASSYSHTAGTVATMTISGGTPPHSVVTSALGPDGKPLFQSTKITSGSTPVNGTQYLAPGSYPFFCGVHGPSMYSTLVVTGTPQARPTVALKVLSKKIAKVAKKGKLKVRATTTGTTDVQLVASLGSSTIASGTITNLGGPGSAVSQLTLSQAGKQMLAHKKKAKITVTGSVDFGSPSSANRKLK